MTLAAERPTSIEDADWVVTLAAIFPFYCTARFAPHHARLWEWVWDLRPGVRPPASINIWARGGAKSTSAEMAACVIAAKGLRTYGLYVCETQDQADDHVASVGEMLESDRVALFYPDLGSPMVNKQGHSRGWRHNRLTTRSGFRLDGVGLDTAIRGLKFGKDRPDFIVIDDVDGTTDTAEKTATKIKKLTRAILPAGSDDVAVLAIQNLVIPDGIFAQLSDGRADFLTRRQVTGPIPALEDMTVDRDDDGNPIIGGHPTWEGQDVVQCQAQVEDFGLTAFIIEAQHEVGDAPGALWCSDQIEVGRVTEHPELDRCVVSVDPSGGKGKGHDEQGIVTVGRGVDGQGYVVADDSCSLSAMGWGKRSVRTAVELGADWITVETNYGGDSMLNTVHVAADALTAEGLEGAERFASGTVNTVRAVTASDSKADRAEPISALYGGKERPEEWEFARVHHMGRHPLLEREMCGWEPSVSSRSPNRVDALVHGVAELGIDVVRHGRRRGVVATGRAA